MQVTAKWTCNLTTSAVLNEFSDSVLTISLHLQEKFMSKLNRDDTRLSLERIVDRHTMQVQTLGTEGHGQLIQETERNKPAEQNKVKDTALIATKKKTQKTRSYSENGRPQFRCSHNHCKCHLRSGHTGAWWIRQQR